MRYRITVIEQDELVVDAENRQEAEAMAIEEFRQEVFRDNHSFQAVVEDVHE